MEDKQHNLEDDTTFAKEALLCTIGDKLKQAREAKSLSKEKVLQELKFNAAFLDALEGGEWSDMPGEIYALGFLRQYADLLNLDLTADIERIKTSSYELTTPLTYPDAPISPNKTWAVIAALIFILVIITTNLFISNEPVEQVTETNVENSTTNKDEEATISPLTSSSYANPDHIEKITVTPEPKASTMLIQEEQKSDTFSYSFIAVLDDVWLQVYEKNDDNELKLNREVLLKKGQAFSIDSQFDILITSGKPTALKITKNNLTLYKEGALGEEGKILKLFPLK